MPALSQPIALLTFQSYFPEADCVSPVTYAAAARRAYILSCSLPGICNCFSDDVLYNKQELALALLTAHILSMSNRAAQQGGSGGVRSVKSGDDEIVFAQLSSIDYADPRDWLAMSSYGQELLMMISTNSFGFLV